MRSSWFVFVAGVGVAALAACHRAARPTTLHRAPSPSVLVGSCASPGRDGVIGGSPRLERADRDLNGDGVAEAIAVDRALCSAEGNCYWNAFVLPRTGASDCARYVGTFEGSALEPMTTLGDDNMADVRGYWNLHGGRLLLQSYRFVHGGYRLVDALLCKRARDDTLECADSEH
ncbi:MAG TPA: hypothetical protein VK607_07090 [Kofleriaceae bacterium]|nr:hypothetical protein [Kofleriaceae bacterium]HMG54806.1 hypothetical protein [Kofleriaceae bacterium]